MFMKFLHILAPSKMFQCQHKVRIVIENKSCIPIVNGNIPPLNTNCANKILHISTILEGRSWLSKGMAYVEYESNDHVVEAIKMMDGGKYCRTLMR